MTRAFRQLLPMALGLALVSVLSGCGGGGGGGGGDGVGFGFGGGTDCTTETIQTPTGCLSVNQFELWREAIGAGFLATREYKAQPGLRTVNAHEAHAALAIVRGRDVKPGAGVTVGVWDTGVDLDHSVFIGANVTESLLQGVENEVSFPGGSYSHGTAVTSIISARPAGSPFAGVAWGANFKVFAAPLGQSTQEIASNYDWVEASKTVLESGVDVVNLSFGTPGLFVENFTADQLHAGLPELVVHAQKDVAEPTIFVWAAGNDHNGQCTKGSDNCVDGGYDATSPSPDAGAVAKVEELRGHTVVVVALGTDNKIASFSNRCGIAGAWCITAPGVDIHGAYHGAAGRGFLDKYFSGTSFAAPMVTGGLALLKQFFRGQLSNPELVTRLFATADKSGRNGTMSTYTAKA